jgi:hypothetical protein
MNQEINDLITNGNNSFNGKKPASGKWVLMNSKHVRNKSEVKSGNPKSASILNKDISVLTGVKEQPHSVVRIKNDDSKRQKAP